MQGKGGHRSHFSQTTREQDQGRRAYHRANPGQPDAQVEQPKGKSGRLLISPRPLEPRKDPKPDPHH
jgi:hypothetical protein